jgi:hypothetical protein
MKLLSNKEETMSLLRQCCQDGQELVFAAFYFWYAGNSLQKSVCGLLRTIIRQTLIHCPALAKVAFPQYFTTPDIHQCDFTWQRDELIKGLEAIIGQHDKGSTHKKFCFFIDGLDECAGNGADIVQLLFELPRSQSIKLCVSSRPWTVFRDAFELSAPHLRLEDLSRPDISHYVDDRIRHGLTLQLQSSKATEHEVRSLVKETVDKAEGVFMGNTGRRIGATRPCRARHVGHAHAPSERISIRPRRLLPQHT